MEFGSVENPRTRVDPIEILSFRNIFTGEVRFGICPRSKISAELILQSVTRSAHEEKKHEQANDLESIKPFYRLPPIWMNPIKVVFTQILRRRRTSAKKNILPDMVRFHRSVSSKENAYHVLGIDAIIGYRPHEKTPVMHL
ncbi:MAG: hypothetical protein AB1547_07125 [Thermodesulfobacteriota bacterium]